jgi:hypothetical protein
MSKAAKDQVAILTPYKSVLILGSEILITLPLLSLYMQKGYLIIGNGFKKLESLNLEVLKGKISATTKFNIYAHGLTTDNTHHLDGSKTKDTTSQFLTKLSSYNPDIPLNVHLYSCYAGAAAPAVDVLPPGSTFIAHGETEVIWKTFADKSIFQSNKDLTITNPMLDFANNFLSNISQMATISIKAAPESFKYTVRSPRRILSQPEEIIRYFTAERSNFILKYNETFPDNTIDLLTLPAITIKDALKWKEIYNAYSLTLPREHGETFAKRINDQLKTFFDIEINDQNITKLPFLKSSHISHSIKLLFNPFDVGIYIPMPQHPIIETFEHLQAAYDKGVTIEEKKSNAKEAFTELLFENDGVKVNNKFIKEHRIKLLETLIKISRPEHIKNWVNKYPSHFNDNNMAKMVIDLCDDRQVALADKSSLLSSVKKAYNQSWRSNIDIKELESCEDRLRYSTTEYLVVSNDLTRISSLDNEKATQLLQQAITEKDFAFISQLVDKPGFVVEMNDNLKSQIIKFAKINFRTIDDYTSLEKQLEILEVLQKLDKKTDNILEIPFHADDKKTLSDLITEEIGVNRHMLGRETDVKKDIKSNLKVPLISKKTIDGLISVHNVSEEKSSTISVIPTHLKILKSQETKGKGIV